MGGVDCGEQHRLTGEGIENVAHFKNWYNKVFLVITDFSFFQGFTPWNLAVNSAEIPKQYGQPKFRELKKWAFYSISSKEMMTYVDNENFFERVQT